ncbi:MAG TPA: hypothetical protein VFV38_22365 [Ktedonobacteraceae bacterium]|nr:hypothetical protein [Ktedonobacteraceae bacterium]
MTIARVFDGKGWTPQQYDTLIKRINGGYSAPPGVLYHWAAATSEGMYAVDVYENREAADRLGEMLGPLVDELGFSMPTVSEFEVYTILQPQSSLPS